MQMLICRNLVAAPPPPPPPPRLLASIFHSGWEESRKSFYIVKFIGFCFRPSPTPPPPPPPGSFFHPQILLIKNKLYQKPSEYRFMLTIHYNMQICLISAVQNSTVQFSSARVQYAYWCTNYKHRNKYFLFTAKENITAHHWRRINPEENAKVVAAVWGTYIPCRASYFALRQFEE